MKKKIYIIRGLDCPNCALLVESAIKKIDGITDAGISFATEKLVIEYDSNSDLKELYSRIVEVIKANEDGVFLIDPEKAQIADVKKSIFTLPNILKIIGVLFFIFAVVFEETGLLDGYFSLILYLPAYLLVGYEVLYRCIRNIIRGRIFDENFLMTLATVGALFLGEYLESVSVMIFYQLGEFFNRLAGERSRNSVRTLIRSKTMDVTLCVDEHNTEIVSAENVKPGDKILIKAGEQVQLDSIVLEGSSILDNSALTGESLPVNVGPGDEMFSGAVNLSSLLTASVARGYSDSMASQIIDMVENASSRKSKSEQFITKFSKVYTPIVVAVAFIIGVIVPLAGQLDFSEWLRRGLMVLLVSCPCALVLSIPMCYFGGLGAASKRRILLKGGNYLDAMSGIKNIVLDKTGTLTEGVFRVKSINPTVDRSESELLYFAAYAESMSTHPIARGIVKEYPEFIDKARIAKYSEIGGYGISAYIDGKYVLCGNAKHLAANNVQAESIEDATTVFVAVDGEYYGFIKLADAVKTDAREAIANMRKLGVEKAYMLTGDKENVANEVAAECGIDNVYAELLPTEKLDRIEEIKKSGRTAFVGEGINDALALSGADIGIAMGIKGSDVATAVSDVIIMTDELDKINTAIKISRRVRFLVYINIVFIMLVKALVMAFSISGLMSSLLLAEVADVGVAVVATIIAMTILRYDPEKHKIKVVHTHNH